MKLLQSVYFMNKIKLLAQNGVFDSKIVYLDTDRGLQYLGNAQQWVFLCTMLCVWVFLCTMSIVYG